MPSKMLNQFPCRCKKCGARRTLPKEPRMYKIEKYARCHYCKGELRVDWYRKNKEHRENTCNCWGIPYPHRKGSSVWCAEHPTGPTQQDYEDRYRS